MNLELRRKPKTIAQLQACRKTPTAGRIFEFIGTQGIGKSTICRKVHDHVRSYWFFRHDLKLTGPKEILNSDIVKFHQRILFQKLSELGAAEQDTWRFVTRARQASEVIYESLLISTHDFPRGFMLEEGLFKNFSDVLITLPQEAQTMLCEGRAFVHLRARAPDVVVSRFQDRAANRRSSGIFQHFLSDEEIRRRVESDNEIFDDVVEKAKRIGCPTLVIYAEDDFSENIRKVLDFEGALR